MSAEFSSDPVAQEEFDRRVNLITTQQQIIVDLLDEFHEQPQPLIETKLRQRLAQAGLSEPPADWVETVAAEVAADRLYVVAPGSANADAFNNEAANRARQRSEEQKPSSS